MNSWNRDHSVVFEIASKYCISDCFVDHNGYSISSKGFLPTVVDIMEKMTFELGDEKWKDFNDHTRKKRPLRWSTGKETGEGLFINGMEAS